MGVAPDAPNFNWLIGDINAWVKYLDQLTTTGIPISVIRLINGGNWSFNATSGALSWSAAANLAIPSVPDSANNIPAGSATLADGQIAYVVANLPTSSQGNTSTSTNINQITNMNFVGNISAGYAVTGPGIPASTTVLSVGANFVTLSNNVTSNNTAATYVFVPVGNLSVVVVNNIALVPTINTILLARRAGNFIYLGVNSAQMVLRDGESKTLVGTGYFSVYNATAGQNISAGQLVYISSGAGDGGRTAGALYPMDTSAANQAARGTYAGVVITAVTTGNPATVVYSGFYAETSLTPGVFYYADPTVPGGITSTVPSGAGQKIVPVGFAVTASLILFTGVASGSSTTPIYPILFEEATQYGDGSSTSFPIINTPSSAAALFVFVGGSKVPGSQVSLSGSNVILASAPDVGIAIDIQYTLASQSFVNPFGELPVNTGDGKTFNLTYNPLNQSSIFVFVGGSKITNQQFSLVLGSQPQIILSTAIDPGQTVDTGYWH